MVVLEQSDCFVFENGKVVTFNDEIKVTAPSPFEFDTVIAAADLLKVLGKLPDAEVDIRQKNGEVVVKGKRRRAGITTQAEVLLPFKGIPGPKKWSTIPDYVPDMLKQAARTCGKDLSNPLTTVVHITPDLIEACDNYRLFRAKIKTGFSRDVLIPAYALLTLETTPINKVSVNKGWAHFGSIGDSEISVRCMKDDYMNLDKVLQVKESETVELPANLAEIIDRAEVMGEGVDPLVQITIDERIISIRCQKDNGWYEEKKRIRYKGPKLSFMVNPKFLVEVLKRTRKVQIGQDKLKLTDDQVEFVVCLESVD